ncbi:MAG TPA: type III glutamate--ammonia ligase [Acetobacteraceae bacterium]|nr:type III glutamate--ammonia ligase [Acetobacteraceae bacterium]
MGTTLAGARPNAERLAARADQLGIKYFMVSFVDLLGQQRAKLVPAAAIEAMQQGGAGFAGFAAHFDMQPSDPDMLAVPDPASLIQLPWKPEVGWVASDLRMAGELIEQGPRNTLKRVMAQADSLGLEMHSGVECEFFLITPEGNAIGDAADSAAKPCYDASALMRRYDIIAEICDAMLALGWQPYQNDHEDANGQFEMNWHYAGALTTADRHVFFKFMVRSIAEKHGLRATFMPKPFAHLTGSGCHAHVSLWSGGCNIAADPAGPLGLSPKGYHFMGGLMRHAGALCALLNPTVNSYKRINAPTTISGATWSPNAVTFSGDNRTHMIRVPGGGRFELRLADGSANPYLLQAAILAAGLDGLQNNYHPGDPVHLNMYTESHKVPDAPKLPLNLLDALRAFEVCSPLRSRLGDGFADSYMKLKQQEWNDYARHLTQWERDRTLDC